MALKVVALAGGVGGAKMADGLASILTPEELTIVVNTADDFEHLGLTICPDLDTVTYTLAGVANPLTGWGRAGETWTFLDTLKRAGAPTWFRIGDQDLQHHLERTARLRRGETLTQVTRSLAARLGTRAAILPMSDDPVRTIVLTGEGDLAFQNYFVERNCAPRVLGFRFEGGSLARPAPGVLEALQQAEVVVLCPSNPWVSLDPILSLRGVREALDGRRVVGVSPIVRGAALKGPAAKMYEELGQAPSALAVARHFGGILQAMVIDEQDADLATAIEAFGIAVLQAPTIMRNREDRRRLAAELLTFATRVRA